MSLTVGDLTGFLKLDDSDFNRGIDQAGGRFDGFGGKLVGVAGKAALGAGAALAGLAAKGVADFAGLERGMNEVFTLLPGISQNAMSSMTDDVQAFSKEMGVLPNDVVPALYQSLSAGVPPGNVFDFMETAQKAATAGVADLETSVSAITGTVNAYGEDVLSAGEASDLMFTAVAQGVTTFDELASSLSNVTPIAAANGVAFGDVTAAIATMTKQGEPTASATTKIRQALVELADQGSEAGKAFEEVANKSFRDFIAEGGNLADAMAVMEEAAATNGVSIDQMFGSVEAGTAALMLSGGQAQNFAANIGAMADSAGATEAAYETMDQGIGRSFDRIKAHGAVLLTELGENLAPGVEAAAAWLGENMDGIAETISSLFANVGRNVSQIAELVGPALNVVVETVQTVAEWFRTSSADISGSTGELSAFLATTWTSISEVIETAVDAIVAIFTFFADFAVDLWERFGSHILEFLSGTWDRIKQLIGGVLRAIQGIFDVFAGAFTGDWSRVWDGIKGIFGGVWDAIKAILAQQFELIKTVLGLGVAALSAMWSAAWDRIKLALSTAWASIVTTLTIKVAEVKTFFRDLPGNIVSALGDLGSLLVSAGSDLVRGLLNGIKNMAGAAARAAMDVVRGAVDGVKDFLGISSPSKLFAEIGMDAGRGLLVGMDSMYGDVVREAEAIAKAAVPDLGRAAMVGVGAGALAPAMAGASGGGGTTTVRNEFHFPNYVGDKRELIDTVREGLVSDLRRVPGLELS